ncbi:hypothetical protein BIV57_22045 [Mangrovactinospora gilvigrisea]|uniref:Uncharacterized protein n=1 Tax=Mangrovactinospora gilvigrisea TaxID=1428644 RepID=A0A1J7B9R1_9ACTN|nr:hypothetical protein [Mangrovactinospora gilvigrisea]OIV35333.1 hypothetical protein BIV57_22045 [Mangrovactinospora gilvigrisea]
MSSFMDRAKAKAQQGVAAGREKVEEIQTQRAGQELLRRLGAAYFAEQRAGGAPEKTEAALAALDDFVRENGDAALK